MKSADARVLGALQEHNNRPFDLTANLALLEQVPEVLQLLHFTRQSIPGQYLRSSAYYHDKIGNVHLDGLPETMQRELMFVIWRIIDMGGRVPCASLGAALP